MAKKADILGNPDFDFPNDGCSGWRSLSDCRKCPDYHECDLCSRKVCNYVVVNCYSNGEADELICRYCAKSQGWNETEIRTQAIDLTRQVSGPECWKKWYWLCENSKCKRGTLTTDRESVRKKCECGKYMKELTEMEIGKYFELSIKN